MEQGLLEADACERMRENVRSGVFLFTAEHYKQMWSSRLAATAPASTPAVALEDVGLQAATAAVRRTPRRSPTPSAGVRGGCVVRASGF